MDVSTIWQSGEYKDREDATVHVLTHGLHYGTGAFEGIHAYGTDRGLAIFRWKERLERLYQSTKSCNMEVPYTYEGFTEATLEIIRRNGLDDGYIRPTAFYGYDSLSVSPKDNPTEITIVAWPQGTYLGEDALENDVDVMVSSWRKHVSSQIPTNAKTTGLYVNPMLAGEEVRRNGYVETIVLNKEGNIAEGPGENIFMVCDGKIYTPGPSQSTLDGITRDTVIMLVCGRSYEVDDSVTTSRDELNMVDELFFTGSAIEVAPIRKVDNVVIGESTRDPVTEELQFVSFGLMERHTDDREEWSTYVDEQ